MLNTFDSTVLVSIRLAEGITYNTHIVPTVIIEEPCCMSNDVRVYKYDFK